MDSLITPTKILDSNPAQMPVVLIYQADEYYTIIDKFFKEHSIPTIFATSDNI